MKERLFKNGAISLFLVIFVFWPLRSWAEDVFTVRYNGDSSNRVDLVVLGDGYTVSEMTKYANDVENFVAGMFQQEPFKEYAAYYNVRRVNVVSNESGADHPSSGIYRDTALDATYDSGGIARLLVVNNSKVYAVLNNSVTSTQRDMILVIVNDSTYGGSGGAIAVASTHAAVVELVLHEVGHSFGLLADEYDYGTCNNSVEPAQPNVTKETGRNFIKWNVGGGPPSGWIDPSTPLPTTGTSAGVPGLYEGAKYCPTGLYRSTYNSKMRNLSVPFEQINTEQLIKRTYNWVSPLDSWSPVDDSLSLQQGSQVTFQAATPQPASHTLEILWYIDGAAVGSGSTFTFNSLGLSPGSHQVLLAVRDPTPSVRQDPAEVLTAQHGWEVIITQGSAVLSVVPDSRTVPWAAGTTTFDVSNAGGGTMNWGAEVVSGSPWLGIQSGAAGTNSGTITVSFDQNLDLSPRSGAVRVTAAGAGNSPKDVTVTQAGYSSSTILLSRTSLSFGANMSALFTKSQTVQISSGGQGVLNWTLALNGSWIKADRTSGTGTDLITFSVDPSGLGQGTYGGTAVVSSPGAANTPQTINLTLRVYGDSGTASPFGFFDTPLDGTGGIEGSVPVTGWALDDIEVTKVDIWRDPVGGEATHPNGYVYIGDAVFVEGARPDVETAYPGHPLCYRAGWGYMMLTNFLPDSGNGSLRLHAIAHDKEGHSAELGAKTISCDNAHATLPFGAIDTPAQGGSASGASYVDFGWTLTPQPKSIPTDGSTILVWIDGQPVGRPTYNNYRQDIATLFPGYANSNGAVGYYYLDTTKMTNGVHAIAWSVQDNAGISCGIGSRYFSVMNFGTGFAGGARLDFPPGLAEGGGDELAFSKASLAAIAADREGSVLVKQGFRPEMPPAVVKPDVKGSINVTALEADRIEISLPRRGGKEARGAPTGDRKQPFLSDSSRFGGNLVVGDDLRPLPVGSTLDPQSGLFSWQIGPGFLGEYQFVFFEQSSNQAPLKKAVRISVAPKYSSRN